MDEGACICRVRHSFRAVNREIASSDLGPNPVETLQHTTGDWTLNFLVFTLAITPLRKIFKLPELIRFRRMLGLFAFFYVCIAFSDLPRARPGLQRFGNVGRHREEKIHYGRVPCPGAADSAGGDFDGGDDPAIGREALAGAPSYDLYMRDSGSDSLLLAGEVRRAQAALLCVLGRDSSVVALVGCVFSRKRKCPSDGAAGSFRGGLKSTPN